MLRSSSTIQCASASWFRRLFIANVLASALLATGCGNPAERVVLYCAQDREFAEGVLAEFNSRSGLRVDSRFDTEADKSVSLFTALVNERARPRCDVHWNNEILATIRLQRQGLLEPYQSPSSADFPAATKSRDHTWQAFAARARILLINTRLVAEADRPKSLLDLTDRRWRGRAAMAKPMFGTTATQAACLFAVLGPDAARKYYLGLKENAIHIEPGNKQVAEGVGQGRYAVGVTDTDDAMAEIRAGRPVAIIFPDRDRPRGDPMGSLFIPNTVALIRGSPNPAGGKKLIDYLLSPEVESRLAETLSHQIPMNPKTIAQLPKEIERPENVKVMDVDFDKAADCWNESQSFLVEHFAR